MRNKISNGNIQAGSRNYALIVNNDNISLKKK